MLRNRCGLAWRFLIAFLFVLSFYTPAAQGGPPVLPVIPSKPQPQSSYSLSGYVYNDPNDLGMMVAGDGGFINVPMTLLQYSPTGTQTITGLTNSYGYYYFPNLVAGDTYTIEETPPSNTSAGTDNLGYFQLTSGGTLSAPAGASNGAVSPPNAFSGIMFAPSSSGSYSAVDYNFGEIIQTFPVVGIPRVPSIPGGSGGTTTPSASFSTALAVVGTSNRFLAGAVGTGNLNLSGSVENTGSAGSAGLNWQISALSTGLTLIPTSTNNLAPGSTSLLTGTVSGTSLLSGTQDATFSVSARIGTSGKLGTSTASVLIDPVLSRGIDSVSTANLGRIMAGATTTSNITITSAGAYANFSNLTMNGGSVSTSNSNGTFSVTNSLPVTFNGTTTTNGGATGFNAAFSSTASGPASGTVAIPGTTGLFTGETLASGTPTLPALNVPYSATVLQQRQLLSTTTGTASAVALPIPTGNGGLLSGAVVPVPNGFGVVSTTDSNHTTSVYVNGGSSGTVLSYYSTDGVTAYPNPNPPPSNIQVGMVNVTQTLVNSAGTTSVPVSVVVQGLGGPYIGVASLNVATAESASVKDPGGYAPVNLAYSVANVGYAATGGPVVSGSSATVVPQTFGAPLSAPIASGSRLATFAVDASNNFTGVPLTSVVATAGSSGANSVSPGYSGNGTVLLDPYNSPTANLNYYGTVGSQADILDSTSVASASTVTMAWRNRNAVENGSMVSSATEKLPSGVKWLTSDVVDIEGVPSGTTFALEMSYDDGINTTLDHPAGTPGAIAGSYLAKLVTSGSVSTWENTDLTTTPGPLAQTGVADSLTDFLANEYAAHSGLPHDTVLAELVGSWGVSLPSSPGGTGSSWAIVNSNGQYAVVPEPSTFALLGAGAVGLLFYRRLRRKGRYSITA